MFLRLRVQDLGFRVEGGLGRLSFWRVEHPRGLMNTVSSQMYYSLNSLKGGYIGGYIRDYPRGY